MTVLNQLKIFSIDYNKTIAELIHDLEEAQIEVRRVLCFLRGDQPEDDDESSEPPVPDFARDLRRLAFQVWRARRFRSRVFAHEDLFGEATWDVLLYLFGETSKEHIAVKDACIGAGVPPTSGLRALRVLMDYGLVEREGDKHDRRRKFVRLTALGTKLMQECLGAALDGGKRLGWT